MVRKTYCKKMKQNLINFQVEDFQTFAEQSPISIIITDTKGNITYVNPKFVQLTGYTEEEVIGKNPRLLKSGEMSLGEYKVLWETVLSGNVWKGEFINKKKNGELYNEFAVISPIIDDEGRITKLIGLKEDITELRKFQLDFFETEKFAVLGKMVSYITHEIKSPLTSIKTNIDMLLRKDDLPVYALKSLEIVKTEIMRLRGLLTNMLDYSKQEGSSFSEIYLPDFFDSVYETIEPQLNLRGITLINKISGDKVWGDINRLKSLFILLIENSISAVSDNGAIEIYNTAVNGKCSIFIKDNGCGIKAMNDIFTPFFTTKADGTGLGLPIAKNIIEKHNGSLKLVSSKPGETIFEVTLNRGVVRE